MIQQAKFNIGQIVVHNKFAYRGVIFEVDPVYSMSEEWYQEVATSHPPKDKPWYHVLVDDAGQATYVAERHLSESTDVTEIQHEAVEQYFSSYQHGLYIARHTSM